MNIFYESLPESVCISGREYKIITDFREWIRFSDMLKSDIADGFKMMFTKEMFLNALPEPFDFVEILNAFTSFLVMREVQMPISAPTDNEKSKSNLSYEYDAPYIISAFLRDYGIDLLDIPYLHWWKFKMLLDGLDEKNQIKERVYYRDVDASKIQDKEERKRVLRVKRVIALPESVYVADEEIGDAFAEN